MNGKLYVVASPIGNMQDISARALQVLQDVELIAAEDTREIAKFFKLLGLRYKELISYRDQNHERALPRLLAELADGKDLALVSDRGTPAISDPGYKLVRDVLAAGFEVVAVPGASAVISALSIAGLPTDRFTFLGFLPRTAGKQKKLLQLYAIPETTLVMYESPFRLLKLLQNALEALGDKEAAVAFELTKMHERLSKGSLSSLVAELKDSKIKGEIVVLIRI